MINDNNDKIGTAYRLPKSKFPSCNENLSGISSMIIR